MKKSNQLDFDKEAIYQNKNFYTLLIVFSIIVLFFACRKNYTLEEKAYIKKIEQNRAEKNREFRDSNTSPFNYKKKVEFRNLNYFDVDPQFLFKSKLTEYKLKDTITILGTKGEERKVVRYAWLLLNFNGADCKVNVYEGMNYTGMKYHSIWFTDLTTNNETYEVGRYIDFELVDDPNYEYEIDFNLAYNPYCAYSSDYSCAIPTKEDFLPIKIKAGEKKFYN